MKIKFLLNPVKLALICAFILSTFHSCKKQETSLQKYEKEQTALAKYISDNYPTATPTASGLYFIEKPEEIGKGDKVRYGSIVRVKYEGRFLDGTVFDASVDGTPFEFYAGYGQVIQGWDEAVFYMKNGGKATLIIPSSLAYGSYGSGAIPGYTTLVFDIEITNLN